jgi:hypothetical protein
VSAAPGSRRRGSQRGIVVESDLPRLGGIFPWERELLLPIVEQLVDEVLAEDVREVQTPANEPHAKEKNQEP